LKTLTFLYVLYLTQIAKIAEVMYEGV